MRKRCSINTFELMKKVISTVKNIFLYRRFKNKNLKIRGFLIIFRLGSFTYFLSGPFQIECVSRRIFGLIDTFLGGVLVMASNLWLWDLALHSDLLMLRY